MKFLPACITVMIGLLLLSFHSFGKSDKHNLSQTIVVQNYYYAKSGKSDEVLQWRIHACDVLKEIGVRSGRVLKPIPKNYKDATIQDNPDAIWIVEYPDTATMKEEARKVMATGKFEPVMKHMDSLCKDFKRIYSVLESE